MITKQSLTVLSLTVTLLLTAVGCQTNTSATTSLPAPRFTGPSIQPQSPTQAPVASARQSYSPWKPTLIPGVPSDWIPRSQPRQWKWIVIHHSASPSGSVATFDREHKDKGWDGIGYHFVVGNGRGMGDGEIDPTPRWPIQKWGAHTKTPDNKYNDFGIGICMVGNFDNTQPTSAQLRSVAKLTAFLMKTYHISPNNVLRHGDCKPTDCPGRYTSIARIRMMATQMLADSGYKVPADPSDYASLTPDTELLH